MYLGSGPRCTCRTNKTAVTSQPAPSRARFSHEGGGQVSKEDVADMLLDEALRPTLHSCAVTVGRRVA